MRQRYLSCNQCATIVRVDDGSYLNTRGEQCEHFFDAPKPTDSVLVVFRSPDGKVSIPWEPNTPCPTGYVAEEVRGVRAVRRLEKELDAQDIKRHQQYQLKLQALHGPAREKRREDLKQIIREGVTNHNGRTIRVSEFGRDLAREALRRSERGYSERYDPGNFRRE